MEVPEQNVDAKTDGKNITGEDIDIAAEIERELLSEEAVVPNQAKTEEDPQPAAAGNKEQTNARSVLDLIP